jgi:hypothetical protein
MTTKNIPTDLAYHITQIKTKAISINEPDDIDFNQIDVIGEVAFGTTTIDDNTIELAFEIISNFIDNRTQHTLVTHTGLTKYNLVNIQNIKNKEDNSLSIPDQLMVMLYAMAHTHARALLAVDLKQTIYKDQLFIPVIDPKAILNLKDHI